MLQGAIQHVVGLVNERKVGRCGFNLGAYTQPHPFLVIEATASVHLSAQPETSLPMRPLTVAQKTCSRQAEK